MHADCMLIIAPGMAFCLAKEGGSQYRIPSATKRDQTCLEGPLTAESWVTFALYPPTLLLETSELPY